MSRAFVKEDGPRPSLPDLTPVSPGPNMVTPRGLQQLQARLVAAQEELTRLRARPDRLDLMPEAAAARDIRYFEARLRTAVVIPAPEAPTEVKFGCRVTLEDALGRTRTWVWWARMRLTARPAFCPSAHHLPWPSWASRWATTRNGAQER